MPTPQTFQLGDIVMLRDMTYRIKGFRPVGGMQGLMVMSEAASGEGSGEHFQHIEFLRISDVAECKSLASVA